MSPGSRKARFTLLVAVLFLALLAGVLLYASSKAARLVSGALTDALGQPVSVSLVGFSPESGLTLYGLTIKNPPGFNSPCLLSVKSLNIVPEYKGLARGRFVFGSLGVFSPTVYLERDRSGGWNYQPLLDNLRKGKQRRFTVSGTRIRAGLLTVVGQATLHLPSVELGALSNIEPAPTTFKLTVEDDKGSTLECEGEAGIFTKARSLKAKAAITGEKLERYIPASAGLDLRGSSIEAALDFSYEGNLAAALVTGRLKGPRGQDADMKADVRYLIDAGEIEVSSARLEMPGVAVVSLKGRVTGIPKDPVFDLTLTPSPVELARLGPYLPSGLKAEGVIRPEPVYLKGRLKGGRLQASFKASGSGLTLVGAGVSVRNVVLTGQAVREGARMTVSGSLSGEDGSFKGQPIGSFKTGFSWSPGTAALTGISVKARDITASDGSLTLTYSSELNRPMAVGGSFRLSEAAAWGAGLAGVAGSFRYKDGAVGLDLAGQASGNPITLSAGASIPKAGGLKNLYLSGKLKVAHAESLTPLLAKRGIKLSFAGGALTADFTARGEDPDKLAGSAVLKADGLGLDMGGKPLVRALSCELTPAYDKGALSLPESQVSLGGSFKVSVSGQGTLDGKGWSGAFTARLPETQLASLQEGLLDALPPTLKWGDVGGSAAADVGVSFRIPAGAGTEVKLSGSLKLKGATLSIPDQKVTVGPADGVIPLGLSFGGQGLKPAPSPFRKEPFEREEFPRLIKKYSARPAGVNLTIRKAAFGLFEADNIEMALVAGDGWYEVDWLGLKGFGANAYGYALADFTGAKGAQYAVSLLMSDFSLAELCRRVPGINGYLSGKVAGMVRLFASGTGYAGLAGAASFWCYEAPGEKMVISKEFLKRLMGKSGQTYMFMGDRKFDTGELDAIFSGGYIVFDRLLIAHTNFLGKQDLKVSVAPVSNKVGIEYLLDEMKDVSERAAAVK